jgi:hypothetical protein
VEEGNGDSRADGQVEEDSVNENADVQEDAGGVYKFDPWTSHSS